MSEPGDKLPDAAAGGCFITLGAIALFVFGLGPLLLLLPGSGTAWTNDLTVFSIIDALALTGILLGLWLRRRR